jgi:uncharacterized membrane protein YdbT with pleckstrin-like domain
MAIRLHDSEKVQAQVDFHWVTFFGPFVWFVFLFFIAMGFLAGSDPFFHRLLISIFVLAIGAFPVLVRYVQNRCKHYVVTNERFYVEDGILSKSTREIPLQKINDVTLKQGIIQRMIGTGDVLILAGNDVPVVIKNVTTPEAFRQAVSMLVQRRS